jgi:LppP/LprE lipoprotein
MNEPDEPDEPVTEMADTVAAPGGKRSAPEDLAWSLDTQESEAPDREWRGHLLWAGLVALLCGIVAVVTWFSITLYHQKSSRPMPPSPTSSTVASASKPALPPISTTAITNAPAVRCGLNLDADQVRSAMEALEKGDPGFAPSGVVQSGGNFDPCATLSTVLVYPYGASSSAPQVALMFHKGRYVGTATPAPYAYMQFNAEQTTDTTVVLDFAESAGSCGACTDKGYESIRFRWQGDHIEMVGIPPSYGRAGP